MRLRLHPHKQMQLPHRRLKPCLLSIALALTLGACGRNDAPDPGVLQVSTQPGGAELFVNGQSHGLTTEDGKAPLSVRLSTGQHLIEARKAVDPFREWYGQTELVVTAEQKLAPLVLRLEGRLTDEGRQAEEALKQRQNEREQHFGARFILDQEGTATDTEAGLQWMRCSVGQRWDGKTCTGEAETFTWTTALTVPEKFEFAGHRDWRVPRQDELHSLTYCSSGRRFAPDPAGLGAGCAGEFRKPAILGDIFPETPARHYWTSTPHPMYNYAAIGVSFHHGMLGAASRTDHGPVRLVRDIQPGPSKSP